VARLLLILSYPLFLTPMKATSILALAFALATTATTAQTVAPGTAPGAQTGNPSNMPSAGTPDQTTTTSQHR
jgi:hypothetical protein